jgi:sodium/bile acid cotransporter 7
MLPMKPLWLKRNWFLLGILTALLLGSLIPGLELVLNPGGATRIVLIVTLFLIAGFNLPSEAISSGLKDYRLHLYIQSFVFVLIPAFFLLTTLPFRSVWDQQLYAGIFTVAVLPTTISSCIVFTQVSGGNVMGTMFNAALANILGVIISPVLLSLLMRGGGVPIPASEILRILKSLGLQMLLPIASGQVLRRFFRAAAVKHKKRLSVASNIFILFILYFAFSKTARNPDFLGNLRSLIGPFCYLAVAHLLLLAATPEVLGIALLPLVFYHAFQLLTAGFVKSSRLVRDSEQVERQGRS